MEIERESTEYLYMGVTGDVPSVSAEVAFLAAAERPEESDWESGTVVEDADPLWDDALATGLDGDYYVAILVGDYDSNPVVLTQGDYQAWLRLTDTVERPVRIAPVAVEVQ